MPPAFGRMKPCYTLVEVAGYIIVWNRDSRLYQEVAVPHGLTALDVQYEIDMTQTVCGCRCRPQRRVCALSELTLRMRVW